MTRLFLLVGLLSVSMSPAFADPLGCAGGDVSTVVYSTCDIGNLRFQFGGLNSWNYLYDNDVAGVVVYDTPWTTSDLVFTPTASGFSLRLKAGAQNLAAPTSGAMRSSAVLNFSVAALNGTTLLGESIENGGVSVGGTAASSWSAADFLVETWSGVNRMGALYDLQNYNGITTLRDERSGYSLGTGQISSGDSYAAAFYLESINGGTVSWDGTATTYTFRTSAPTTVPESGSSPFYNCVLALTVLVLPWIDRRISTGL